MYLEPGERFHAPSSKNDEISRMSKFNIVKVDESNVDDFGFFCVKNKKHPGYLCKRSWLQRHFQDGLRIRLILTGEGKQVGFIEYVPAEYSWRVVNAPGYLVIHCIWVESRRYSIKGMASVLLRECLEDARTGGYEGLAVVSSDGTWMAEKAIFLKNGFIEVDQAPPHYQLLIRSLGKGVVPTFPDNWEERLGQYRGLQLISTHQCPYIGKALPGLSETAEMHGVKLRLVELSNAKEAQQKMPSPYGVMSLVYNGRLLADHPISVTRFRNILQKELSLKLI